MATRALILNNIAISSQALGPTQSVSAGRERVRDAVEFGRVLQDLVAHSRLLREEPDAPRVSRPRFPLDLLHRCSPEALLQSALQKLLKLESSLLRIKQPNGRAIPPALPLGKLGNEQGIDALLQAHRQGKGRTVRMASEHCERLLRTLEAQLVNWLGALRGRWAGMLKLLVFVVTGVADLETRFLWRKLFSTKKVRSSDTALTTSRYAVRAM